MRGSTIIVSTGRTPSGVFREGIVKTGETFKPGMIAQRDPSVAQVEGVPTYKLYNADADGGRPKGALWLVTEILQVEQGRTVDPALTTSEIAAGDRVMCYSPRAGEEVNLLYKNETGTSDDVAAGDIFITDDTTGKVTLTTSTPETEIAMALEAVVDPTADTLVWCEWTGY